MRSKRRSPIRWISDFQGLAWFNKGTNPENMAQARGYFERAVALDPGNLDALLGLGEVDYVVGGAYLPDDRDARLAAAETTIGPEIWRELTATWDLPRFSWVALEKPKLMKKRPCASLRATVFSGSGCILRAARRWLLAPMRRPSHCFAGRSRATGRTH